MTKEWETIQTEYDLAKACLRENGKSGWYREQEEGWYHLWNAYHQAAQCETKEPLLYARILSMMAAEGRFHYSDYDLYHKFEKPAAEAYEAAIAAGQKPTDRELEMIRFQGESMKYQLECEQKDFDDQVRWITGHEKLESFDFHDSKPVHFELTDDSATLTLKYHDVLATFQFEGIIELKIEADPLTDWIFECYCYPCYHNKQLFMFDTGYYKIMCSKISVMDVRHSEEQE